jgi:replication initiation and membrane attachment protein DnaB
LISKKTLLKKRKAPLSTQEVYTGTTQLTHRRKPTKTYAHTIPKAPKNPKSRRYSHKAQTTKKKTPPKIHENTPKTLNPKYKQTQNTEGKTQEQQPSKDPKQKRVLKHK